MVTDGDVPRSRAVMHETCVGLGGPARPVPVQVLSIPGPAAELRSGTTGPPAPPTQWSTSTAAASPWVTWTATTRCAAGSARTPGCTSSPSITDWRPSIPLPRQSTTAARRTPGSPRTPPNSASPAASPSRGQRRRCARRCGRSVGGQIRRAHTVAAVPHLSGHRPGGAHPVADAVRRRVRADRPRPGLLPAGLSRRIGRGRDRPARRAAAGPRPHRVAARAGGHRGIRSLRDEGSSTPRRWPPPVFPWTCAAWGR